MMIEEVRTLCTIADDAGFDCFSTTEHHFHSEGYEASVAPLLLYADLAARTKQIKSAPLALVLPAGDPLRAAEQIAYLDHLTKGRVYAGFARGYQQRWVNVLGSGPGPGGAHGRRRRRPAQQAGPRGVHRHDLQGVGSGPPAVQGRVLPGALPVRGRHQRVAGGRLDGGSVRRARSTSRASSVASRSSPGRTSSRTRRRSSRSR